MNLILLVLLSLLTSAQTTRKFISPYGAKFHRRQKSIQLVPRFQQPHSIQAEALPGDYLEKEDEDDDDDEKNTNVEQSPENSARTSVSHHDDGEDLLKKSIQNLQERTMLATTRGAEEEEESSQEEEESSQEEDEDSQEEAQIFQEDQKLESRFGPHYHNTLPWSNSDELPLDGIFIRISDAQVKNRNRFLHLILTFRRSFMILQFPDLQKAVYGMRKWHQTY
ncbi:hypothetical protein Q9233_016160 [Columba guinea]|nr:hypothetical protein Q9233_016160 [Columba guinea]